MLAVAGVDQNFPPSNKLWGIVFRGPHPNPAGHLESDHQVITFTFSLLYEHL